MIENIKIHPDRFFFIIDDDIDDQELLIEALHDIDNKIICYKAGNGDEGLQLLLSRSIPTPQLIFVDLNMPRVNGRQFLNRIKKDSVLKNIPVIIYSTTFDDQEVSELIDNGAADFLRKPRNYNELKKNLVPLIAEGRYDLAGNHIH